MKKFILFILLFAAGNVFSQVYPQIGARSNAMGGSAIGLTDVWSVYNNPGAFGSLEKTAVGVSYENRFLLKEMATKTLAFGYHTEKAGNIGLHMQQYGFSLYREMQLGLTYGMKLFDNFSAGVNMNYHRIALGENYGSKSSISAGLGIFYSMTEDLNFGMRVLNINAARLSDVNDERLPTTFGLGFKYDFSKKAFWSLDAEKDLINPINIKTGIEVLPHESFAVRLGVNSYPFQASFGFGLKLSRFQLDMASMWHAQLGLSPSAGIHYQFK